MKISWKKFKRCGDNLLYWIPLIAITIIVIQLFQPLVARTILPWMGRNLDFDNLPLNIAYGVLLGIILIGAICRLFTKSNLKFSKIFSLGLVALLIVYALYRFDLIPHPFWNFSYLFCSITYIDGVFLATALLCLTYPVISKYKAIRETKRTKKDGESENANKDDLEINAQEDDKFDFYNNALSLLTNLEDRNLDERALIVGLTLFIHRTKYPAYPRQYSR